MQHPFARAPRALWLAALCIPLIACGGDDGASTPAGAAGQGGAAGSAGVGGKSGAAGSAGSAAGAAGSAGQAGSAGSAGLAGSGGAGQGGSAGAGAGGAGAAGATGGSGGAGQAGQAGSGGAEAGSGGSGQSGAGQAGEAGAAGQAGAAGSAGQAGAGGAPDPCAGVSCGAQQKCEAGACVDVTCADLSCKSDETCLDPADGPAYCEPTCASDLDCPAEKFCNGQICEADACKPGATRCEGSDLQICLPNGSTYSLSLSCGSPTFQGQACIDSGDGKAYCPCFDDWDCPAFTACEAGVCLGTGKAPTCSLPPVPFAQALPKKEIQWGGTGQGSPANNAVNAPFPLSSQVSATPMVANLDDDNGDGLIDERDVPEILFMTYCGTDVANNGIVRAIHGGGASKGKDFFASCGNTTWSEGDPLSLACPCAEAEGNSTGAMAVGDLDGDGIPEIVIPNENAGLTILDNTGKVIARSANNQWVSFPVPAVTIANLDGQGTAEIIVGNVAFTLGKDANNKLTFVDRFTGSLMTGKNGQGPIACVADLDGDKRPEIVAGTTAYRLPTPPAGVTTIAQCAPGASDNFCTGKLEVVWDGQTVNGAAKIPNAQRDGFCAIADVLGADAAAAPGPANPLDAKPEVVLISNGFLQILDGATGTLHRSINLNAGTNGGAPNVDDFDGDGFPEIGTAFGTSYLMIDLQAPSVACPAWPNAIADGAAQTNPKRSPGGSCNVDADCGAGTVCNRIIGSCVCLHNGWSRVTEDDSSRVTGSSVFDFNGDGAAEVVYGDECYLRIYDGSAGDVLFKTPATSRTRIENPVIADVDNDGNAEIVHATNNDTNACSEGNNFPNGIAVLGDSSDAWVSARRIWNQHAYHVTNVNESAQIPAQEPVNWLSYGGRSYNTYRSNPRNYGVAPDLAIGAVQASSPDVACGQLSSKLVISAAVDNRGDLRVGAPILTYYGTWGATEEPLRDAALNPLTSTLPSTLEPGSLFIASVLYDSANNSFNKLPDKIRVVVDEANAERECVETNNEATIAVSPGELTADLAIAVGTPFAISCPSATFPVTLDNLGSAPASNVVVRFYAGDPDQGGTPIQDELFAGPIAAFGGTESRDVVLPSLPALSVLIYARVDPDDAIPECNDSNNKDAAELKVDCVKF